jgi:hypothetical protein
VKILLDGNYALTISNMPQPKKVAKKLAGRILSTTRDPNRAGNFSQEDVDNVTEYYRYTMPKHSHTIEVER